MMTYWVSNSKLLRKYNPELQEHDFGCMITSGDGAVRVGPDQ